MRPAMCGSCPCKQQTPRSGAGLLVPPLGPWLVPLAGLTSLSLDWRGLSLVLNSSLACLADLQRLGLSVRQTELPMLPGASLPPALTSLHVCRYFGPLPIQAGELQHLREVTLVAGGTQPGAYDPLVELRSSLTALNLTGTLCVPNCLRELTALRRLTIDSPQHLDGQLLEDALPRLQQLTAVCLVAGGLPQAPHALCSLRCLHTVCWARGDGSPAPLPGGPWLARLRFLALPCYLLSDADRLETLSDARQLERLGVSNVKPPRWHRQGAAPTAAPAPYRTAEVLRILRWAPQHASLQLLALARMTPEVAAAAAVVAERRPGLSVIQTLKVFEAVCECKREAVE